MLSSTSLPFHFTTQPCRHAVRVSPALPRSHDTGSEKSVVHQFAVDTPSSAHLLHHCSITGKGWGLPELLGVAGRAGRSLYPTTCRASPSSLWDCHVSRRSLLVLPSVSLDFYVSHVTCRSSPSSLWTCSVSCPSAAQFGPHLSPVSSSARSGRWSPSLCCAYPRGCSPLASSSIVLEAPRQRSPRRGLRSPLSSSF